MRVVEAIPLSLGAQLLTLAYFSFRRSPRGNPPEKRSILCSFAPQGSLAPFLRRILLRWNLSIFSPKQASSFRFPLRLARLNLQISGFLLRRLEVQATLLTTTSRLA